MKPIPLVRGWILPPAINFLRERGAPVYRWLEAAGLPARVLDTPHLPLPLPAVLDFVDRSARALEAETLGLEIGRNVAAETLGTWGRLLADTPTLYERIRRSIEWLPLHHTGLDMWLETEGPMARFSFQYVDGLGPGVVHGEDFTLMITLEVFQRTIGEDFRPYEIVLTRRRGDRFRRDRTFRDVPVVYRGKANQIVVPVELLERPLPRLPLPIGHEDALEEVMRHVPSADVAGSVLDTVTALLPRGCPSIEEMAELAATSVRSLQRELAQSGLSYSKLVDMARLRLAQEYLRDPSANITEIGLQLGYGDGTAFTRAFRRWTGVSPTEYRRQLGEKRR